MPRERRDVAAATVDEALLLSFVGGRPSCNVPRVLDDLGLILGEFALVVCSEMLCIAISLRNQRLDETDMAGFESHSLGLPWRVWGGIIQDS